MQLAISSPRTGILFASTLSLLIGGCMAESPPDGESDDIDSPAPAAAPSSSAQSRPIPSSAPSSAPSSQPAAEICAACHGGAGRTAESAIAELRSAPDRWQSEIACSDALVRAAAADMVPANPGANGAAVLEELVLVDPEARVREHGVIAYGSLLEHDAVPFLRHVALSDANDEVTQAAQAELYRIREESPEPPRGFLKIAYPDHFEVGEPFDVRVTFGSKEDVPEAKLTLKLPRGVVPASRTAPRWRGALQAGQPQEVAFSLRADSPLRSRLRVRLALDYPARLDVEVLKQDVRVEADQQTGTLAEPRPAKDAD